MKLLDLLKKYESCSSIAIFGGRTWCDHHNISIDELKTDMGLHGMDLQLFYVEVTICDDGISSTGFVIAVDDFHNIVKQTDLWIS